MAEKILAKDKLEGFLGALRQSHEVFAPAMVEGKVAWAPVEGA